MKTCTDTHCPNKALRNSPMCMEHVKRANVFPMRSYQKEMLRQMATTRAMLANLDARRAETAKRERMAIWETTGMPSITTHQTAVQEPGYAARYGARGWFGMDVMHYKMPEKRVSAARGYDVPTEWK